MLKQFYQPDDFTDGNDAERIMDFLSIHRSKTVFHV